MCGVAAISGGLCDLDVTGSRSPQDIIRYVLLVNSPNKLELLWWLFI